ncbi:MAG: argininosuccinate synthase [Deltaproteobacteria bacterium]|nr:argininosuccinate synthase [Deltaproteobacteria bacterium]
MKASDLKGQTIVFAASGGLDSCTITRWLTDLGVKVVCATAHLGQPDEPDMDLIRQRMLASGAVDHVLVDARNELAEAGLNVLQSQSTYEGRYWNTTGIARYVTTKAIIGEMRKRGIKVFSHGATGRGNDQVRFQLATNMLAPEFEVYAPWRDETFLANFRGRTEMIEFCEKRNVPVKATKNAPYSTDANMLGLTHEAGKLEELATPAQFITPGRGVHAKDAPERGEEVEVRFENGRPVSINGKKLNALDAILAANAVAGKHGIGIGIHLVENRFVGIKSRGVYESPGMELLGTTYAMLLQLVLDRRSRELFDALSLYVSKQIYQGFWYDTGTQMAMAGIERSSRLVTGTVRVLLQKGTISYVAATDVPHSLYREDEASMEAIGSYDHADAEGLLRIFGVSARVLSKAGHIQQ